MAFYPTQHHGPHVSPFQSQGPKETTSSLQGNALLAQWAGHYFGRALSFLLHSQSPPSDKRSLARREVGVYPYSRGDKTLTMCKHPEDTACLAVEWRDIHAPNHIMARAKQSLEVVAEKATREVFLQSKSRVRLYVRNHVDFDGEDHRLTNNDALVLEPRASLPKGEHALVRAVGQYDALWFASVRFSCRAIFFIVKETDQGRREVFVLWYGLGVVEHKIPLNIRETEEQSQLHKVAVNQHSS